VTSRYVENINLTGKIAVFVSFYSQSVCLSECAFVGSAGNGTFGCGLAEEALLQAIPAPIF